MMKKLLVCLIVSICYFSVPAQKVMGEVAALAKELGEGINKGFYEKSWKKTKDGWLELISESKNEEELYELVDKLAGNISSKAYKEQPALLSQASLSSACNNLLKICENAKKEAFNVELQEITDKLRAVLKRVEDAALLDSLRKKMKPFLNELKQNFSTIFDDSKKGGFDATKKGELKSEGKIRYFETDVTIGGVRAVVAIGPEENQRFQLSFNCFSAQDAALELCKSIEPLLNAAVPETYKKSKDFSPEFAGSIYAYVWEHVSEKFVEIAKKPTISVGVIQENGNFLVNVKIMEPVFKR